MKLTCKTQLQDSFKLSMSRRDFILKNKVFGKKMKNTIFAQI